MTGREEMGEGPVLLADSATVLGPGTGDAVIICGSHGGVYAGSLVARAGCRGAIFHDAGIGKDEAGVGSLILFESLGLPAAAVDYRSARIGDAADMRARGTISRVNAVASGLGCTVGDSAAHCAGKMARSSVSQAGGLESGIVEHRVLILERGRFKGWAVDSAAQVGPGDAGSIIVTGSHGGLVGGRPAAALKADACLAVFNDAGVGMDRAGIGRLDALAARGIPAATVATATARIGDGVSTYQDGIVSFLNARAEALGGTTGQTARDLVATVLDRLISESSK